MSGLSFFSSDILKERAKITGKLGTFVSNLVTSLEIQLSGFCFGFFVRFFLVCLCVYLGGRCPQDPAGIKSVGAGVPGSCELPSVGARNHIHIPCNICS